MTRSRRDKRRTIRFINCSARQRFCAAAFLFAGALILHAGETCVPQPASGLGANGPYGVIADTIRGLARERAFIFLPDTPAYRAPVVILCHRAGASDPRQYGSLIRHIASRGYAVVFPLSRAPSFKRNEIGKYRMFITGYREAVRAHAERLDTTRIGIIGHGLGGGAAAALMRALIIESGWARAGAFMFILSPWYVHGIDERQLRTFPRHVKTVIQVFTNDRVNDPKIAMDLYRSIGLAPANKRFMVISGDRWGACRLRADAFVPEGEESFGGEDDALDFYGIWRPLDAVALAAFEGADAAMDSVLGPGGASHEVFMGTWPDGVAVKRAVVTERPDAYIVRGPYANTWYSPRNPRIDLTRFRKARKIYFTHFRDKMAILAEKGKQAIRRQKAHADDFDAMENPIRTGFGADGGHGVISDSFPAPGDPSLAVKVLRPAGVHSPAPVIFFIPGYGSTEAALFEPFVSHIVSRGYAMIFSPYPTLPVVSDETTVLDKYRIIMQGFDTAAARFGAYLDLSRIGVFGQSFGGGAAPAVARKLIAQRGWGSAGAFMHITAPWYSFDITPGQLDSFPSHVKLVMQVFDDDAMNDHQMAVDIFSAIGIPAAEKNYLTIFTDSLEGFRMEASHFTPYGRNHINGEVNLLDYYGIFKIFDALAEYAFTGSEEGKRIALGNGSTEQCFMGEWAKNLPVRPMIQSSLPLAAHPQLEYVWAWDNRLNPRRRR